MSEIEKEFEAMENYRRGGNDSWSYRLDRTETKEKFITVQRHWKLIGQRVAFNSGSINLFSLAFYIRGTIEIRNWIK